MPRDNIHQSGFTLIEVLFTLMFLGLGLGTITMMYGHMADENTSANERVVALQLGRQVYESLTALKEQEGYEYIMSKVENEYCKVPFTSPFERFTCVVSVKHIQIPIKPDLDDLDDFDSAITDRVSLDTYKLSEKGLLSVEVSIFWGSNASSVKLRGLFGYWE